MNNQSNVVYVNFENHGSKRQVLGISMTKTRKHGNFKVHTNLAKLTHQEFFYEMLRSAIMLEKEVSIQDSINS